MEYFHFSQLKGNVAVGKLPAQILTMANGKYMVPFWESYYFLGQIYHFYGSIITLDWPLYTLSNSPEKSWHGSDLPPPLFWQCQDLGSACSRRDHPDLFMGITVKRALKKKHDQ